jgi:hypothetical protein
MQRTDRPLTSEERNGISSFIHVALKWIGADETPETPDQLQELISQAIFLFREQPQQKRETALLDVSMGLGSLWGQILCDQFGWTWAYVTMDAENSYFGIVTPARSHVIFPLHYIKDILSDIKTEQTSLMLYNMLKARILPEAKEREYLVVG